MIKVWTDSDSTKIELPTPSSFEYTFSDLDKDSGRNDYGLMQRNRLTSKVKLTIGWNAQDKDTHNRMITILKSLPVFFYCEYPDPSGNLSTIECYRGDIKTGMYKYSNGGLWKETQCNFIQR